MSKIKEFLEGNKTYDFLNDELRESDDEDIIEMDELFTLSDEDEDDENQ